MATLASVILRGTFAARPAAGTAGRLYYDTTNSVMYRDSGSAWESVEGEGGGAVDSVNGATGVVVLDAGDVGAEPALGNPASDGYVLSSTAAGVRSWAAGGGGGGATDFTDLGDVPTAYTGEVGKYVVVNATEDGLEFAGSAAPAMCLLYNSTTQSVANNTTMVATFDSERYDTNGMHSTSVNTGRITIQTTGKYRISGYVSYANAGNTTQRYADIRLNGSTTLWIESRNAYNGDTTSFSLGGEYDFTAGDYLELRLFHIAGGANAVTARLAATQVGSVGIGAGGLSQDEADLRYAALSTAPTIEDLQCGTLLGDIPSTQTYPVLIAQTASKAMALALVCSGGITASDSNYWTVELKRYRAGTATLIATKTTKVTGGQAVTANVPWTFSGVTFDTTYQQLSVDDALVLVCTKTGTPSDLSRCYASVRYEPV
jgi:hypothetical protein